ALHGDLPQGARNRTIRALRERRVRVLVATDVAARGIDIPGITHVFNYDLPKFAEDYEPGVRDAVVPQSASCTMRKSARSSASNVNVIAGFEPKRTPAPRAPVRRGPPARGQGRGTGGSPGRGNGYGNPRQGAGGSREGGSRDGGSRGGYGNARTGGERARSSFADSRGPARRYDNDRRTSRYDD
ncbi:hypothetical protein DFQ30_004658, partial [Apophysomyces sp. BC1015]